MEEMLRLHLLTCAGRYEAATGTTPATIGKRALNDNTFFARIGDGQGFTVKTYDRVIGWLWDNWPEGAKWPREVPRPESAGTDPSPPFPAATVRTRRQAETTP